MHTLQKRKSHTNVAVVISVASVQWFLVVAFARRVYRFVHCNHEGIILGISEQR